MIIQQKLRTGAKTLAHALSSLVSTKLLGLVRFGTCCLFDCIRNRRCMAYGNARTACERLTECCLHASWPWWRTRPAGSVETSELPHSPRLRSSAGTAQAKVPTSALFSVAWRAWDHERAVKQHPGICGPITAWQHQQTCSSSWHAAVLLHLKPLREVQVVGSDASQG